jgi:hypothetical protein
VAASAAGREESSEQTDETEVKVVMNAGQYWPLNQEHPMAVAQPYGIAKCCCAAANSLELAVHSYALTRCSGGAGSAGGGCGRGAPSRLLLGTRRPSSPPDIGTPDTGPALDGRGDPAGHVHTRNGISGR